MEANETAVVTGLVRVGDSGARCDISRAHGVGCRTGG